MSRLQSVRDLLSRTVRTARLGDTARSYLVASAVIVSVVAASCDKVPLTSPTGSTILLSASTSIVPVDGSAEITATVTESSGTAVQNGTTVVFRADLGRMDPQEAQTTNGRAISRFFASGMSGVARVNAYSGAAATGGSTTSGNSSSAAPGSPLTLLVGGAAASRVTVRAEPPTLPQSGGTTQIFASVSDTNGAPVLGAPVTFSLSGNASGNGPGILSAPTTQTNAAGVAQTSLTTNQTTTITATVAAASATSPVTANVVVTALAAPTVAISVCTAAQSVGVAVNCTITPTANGGVAIQNLTVNWGDNTGEQPLGSVSATSVSHTYTAPGNYTMVAAATDLNSQRGTAAISFVVTRVNPTITITASATTGSIGVPISFTVTPAPNPPQPITNVTVDFGDGSTRNLGVISSVTTIAKSYSAEGTFTVTATVTDQSGGRGNATTQVVIGHAAAPTITFTQTSSLTPAATPATPEAFSVSATAATGLSIRSIVVKNAGGTVLYSGTGGGTFAAAVTAGDILTATVTDSAGNTSTSQVVVQ